MSPSHQTKNAAPGLAHIWNDLKEVGNLPKGKTPKMYGENHRKPTGFGGGKPTIFGKHPFPHWFYSLTGKQHISLIFSHVTQVFEDSMSGLPFWMLSGGIFFGAAAMSWCFSSLPQQLPWQLPETPWQRQACNPGPSENLMYQENAEDFLF